ncbi:MAG: type II secretion system protein J [Ilumatobacter sp.]|uniref:PulJ/GspJ family protein n=1 Tax=Ilumatobacter sp. TaxID=1967498 RepID=UPI00391A76ED
MRAHTPLTRANAPTVHDRDGRGDQDDRGDQATPRDRGNTIMEVIIAIVLMGFAVSVIVAGIRMTIIVSSTSDSQAKVEAVLTSAADRLANWAYRPCPGENASDYVPIVQAAASAVGWDGSTIEIDDIAYWNPEQSNPSGDSVPADGGWVDSNTLAGDECNEDINLTTSRTLQRITIRATSPDGDLSRTIEVVKSNIVADPTEGGTP